MNKKFATLSACLLSVVCLASCAQECTLAELTAQASKYDASAVREEYSRCTVKTQITSSSDSDSSIIQALTTGGETETSEETTSVLPVATSADLTSIVGNWESQEDYIKYYLDGTAIKITLDYEGDVDYSSFSGEGTISYEFTTYSDGRYKKVTTEYSIDTTLTGHYEYKSVVTYSYTKA